MDGLEKKIVLVEMTEEDVKALNQVHDYLVNKPLPMIEIEGGVVFIRQLLNRISNSKQVKS